MGEYRGFGYLYWLRWKPNTCNVKSLSVSFQWKSWAVITQVASLQPRLCLLDSSLHSREVKGMDSRALEKLVLTCHGACWGRGDSGLWNQTARLAPLVAPLGLSGFGQILSP